MGGFNWLIIGRRSVPEDPRLGDPSLELVLLPPGLWMLGTDDDEPGVSVGITKCNPATKKMNLVLFETVQRSNSTLIRRHQRSCRQCCRFSVRSCWSRQLPAQRRLLGRTGRRCKFGPSSRLMSRRHVRGQIYHSHSCSFINECLLISLPAMVAYSMFVDRRQFFSQMSRMFIQISLIHRNSQSAVKFTYHQ